MCYVSQKIEMLTPTFSWTHKSHHQTLTRSNQFEPKTGYCVWAVSGVLDLQNTNVPVVRIAASASEADPANNVIAPIPGDRTSCLAFIAGDESSLPLSFDAERGIEKLGIGYYKRLARSLTHLKAMVAAYRLNAPAVLILDEQEQPVKHPDFKWDVTLDKFVENLSPGWTHVQLSVLALSDSFGTLVKDWDARGRPSTLSISAEDRARPDTELWSYGAYLVSKSGLANTLLTYSNRDTSGTGPKTLKFDLSRATCIEADNCLLWEGVHGQGWLVATPPLLAAGKQVTYDEADAVEVEVAVSELVKENMYHAKRWWESPDSLLEDARAGSLSLPSKSDLDQVMEAVGIKPVTFSEVGINDATPFEKKDQNEGMSVGNTDKGGDGTFYEGDDTMKTNDSADTPDLDKSTAVELTAQQASEAHERQPMTPAERAAADAAGITRTQSAFDMGKDLWNRAWGNYRSTAPQQSSRQTGEYVAAAGKQVASGRVGAVNPAGREREPSQDDIAHLLDQYKSEPFLGNAPNSKYVHRRARASAPLAAWNRAGGFNGQGGVQFATAALGSAPSVASSSERESDVSELTLNIGAVAVFTVSTIFLAVAVLRWRGNSAAAERNTLLTRV